MHQNVAIIIFLSIIFIRDSNSSSLDKKNMHQVNFPWLTLKCMKDFLVLNNYESFYVYVLWPCNLEHLIASSSSSSYITHLISMQFWTDRHKNSNEFARSCVYWILLSFIAKNVYFGGSSVPLTFKCKKKVLKMISNTIIRHWKL